jgi:hypothetical protein
LEKPQPVAAGKQWERACTESLYDNSGEDKFEKLAGRVSSRSVANDCLSGRDKGGIEQRSSFEEGLDMEKRESGNRRSGSFDLGRRDKTEVKYSLCHEVQKELDIETAQCATDAADTKIERGFQEIKEQIGLAEYQIRGWRAWHHPPCLDDCGLCISFWKHKWRMQKTYL